jgi:hypothetical protein
MRNSFISFGRLAPGSYFDARSESWVKASNNTIHDGVYFNSYNAEDTANAVDFEKDPVTVELFPDEMLVKYNPDEKLAPWAYQTKKADK